MLWNYLITAFRVIIRKQKLVSLISVAGLSTGMACALLIFLYVRYEFSYDKYHENAARIFRLVGDLNRNEISPESAMTAPPMAPALAKEIPGIAAACRILPGDASTLVQFQEKRFHEAGFGYVDPSIFRIFSFSFLEGNPATALEAPRTVVITQTTARKYFGDQSPVGKRLLIDNKAEYEITGVIADMPRNSHFRFDFLAPFTDLSTAMGGMYNCWWCKMAYTYLLLSDNTPPAKVEQQLPAFIENHIGPQSKSGIHLRLQPLAQIHLYSHLDFEMTPGGNANYLYILATMGFAVLLLACVNYINLTTAINAQRAKEVGMRKVVGATAKHIRKQFLSESVMMALLALPIAVSFVELCLPRVNQLLDVTLSTDFFATPTILLGLVAISVFIGLLSGIYPAIVLSRFQPVKVLQGKVRLGVRGSGLRNTLVVLQFAISILFITSTATILKQLDFLRNKNLGFDKENVVVLRIADKVLNDNFEAFKGELLTNPKIVSVSRALHIPSERMWDFDVWPGDNQGRKHKMKVDGVDYDYFEILNVRTVEGRTFSKEFPTDANEAFVLNEAAVKLLGWQPAVGRRLEVGNRHGQVIGVIQDFHFESLHHKIEPAAFCILEWYNYALVRVHPDHLDETLAFLEKVWQIFQPYRPFEYTFLDARFDVLYKKEATMGEIFSYFSGLTIIIACLGLFGLAAFATERRLKECGIRKVFGAKTADIVVMISKEFVILVAIASVVAWPVAYFGLSKWLRDFAYRVDLDLWGFFLAGLAALIVAFAAVSFHALKLAVANPVNVLKYE